jgi:sterol desaturase/sphingolipid hydroxylase (fatty acid hydroxylase superfamily)
MLQWDFPPEVDSVKTVLTYLSFPIVFIGALGLCATLQEQGFPRYMTVSVPIVLGAIGILILERIHPQHGAWNISHNDEKTDALHLLVSMVVVPEALRISLLLLLVGVAVWLSELVAFIAWPTQWPLALQLALAMVIAEFGSYWAHRLMHQNQWLWRLHATHHSAPRLYWLNAARFHPLDTTLQYIGHVIPLLLMGCTEEVLALFTVFTAVHGMFQHANIRMRLGPFNWVFSMAELHRWHHSTSIEEGNSNYGANLILWDIVFGTRYLPSDRTAPTDIGIHELPAFPEGYMAHLASPFTWASQVEDWKDLTPTNGPNNDR